jgi:poly-beta-hydroxybutyrate-responsive repressor
LLLLRERRAHGYELLERLGALGFGPGDAGGRYRVLRRLETDGLVRSAWEKSTAGPDRRTYELTRAGIETLHSCAMEMLQTRGVLSVFLSRYSEFVALDAAHR